MEVAVCIIAVVEIIRIIQNGIQLTMLIKSNSNKNFDRATDAFVESLKRTDEDFAKELGERLKDVRP